MLIRVYALTLVQKPSRYRFLLGYNNALTNVPSTHPSLELMATVARETVNFLNAKKSMAAISFAPPFDEEWIPGEPKIAKCSSLPSHDRLRFWQMYHQLEAKT